MTLQKIKIENIKGFSSKSFDLDILPNKPSLLVAQNGLGKTSFAVAFKSMNSNRIVLHKDHWHQENEALIPKITIHLLKSDNSVVELKADNDRNEISNEFDWFVINNQVRPKGIGQSFSGRTNVSATFHIEPITLIESIPEPINLNYSVNSFKQAFGKNGKILPNLSSIFENLILMTDLQDVFTALERSNGVRVKQRIAEFINEVNLQNGKSDVILDWIETNKLSELRSINYLNEIGDFLRKYDLGFTKTSENYLVAIQIICLFEQYGANFKKFCKRKAYEYEKEVYKQLFSNFSTWKEITPAERSGSLIVEFPKAHLISNGQRDVLCVLALIKKAEFKLRKSYNILILDEIFDYLDDANLITVQYYLTKLLEKFQEYNRINPDDKKFLYPLILTHLNPQYFRTFAFSDQKVYYLFPSTANVNQALMKLLRHRNDKTSTINDDIDKYLMHFHTAQINRRTDFQSYGLKETWGEFDNFDKFIEVEIEKYINNQADYDPFAICCAVRKRIEKNIFNRISDTTKQSEFLNTHTTAVKLEYAMDIGIIVPETYFMLGIIYNDALHWNEKQRDNISPTASKLENAMIRKIIKEVFEN